MKSIHLLRYILNISIGMDLIITGRTQASNLSWYDAQTHCQRIGKRLAASPPDTNDNYWTSRYTRLSFWIKILGCFPDSVITDSVRIPIIMVVPSVGMCQELCLEKNILTFAVKNSSCVCILTDSTPTSSPSQPKDCSYICGFDKKSFFECGGPSAYNIYLSGTEMENKKSIAFHSNNLQITCVAIQCSDPKFFYTDCSLPYAKICENRRSSQVGVSNSWRISMDDCKRSTTSSYLIGNITLGNARQTCKTMNKTGGGQTWIGIANQIYTSIDRGNKMKISFILNCQICYEDGKCNFTSCITNANFTCVNLTNSENSTDEKTHVTRIQTSMMLPYNSSKSTSQFKNTSTSSNGVIKSTVTMTTKSLGYEEEETFLPIIIPLCVVLPLSVAVAVAAVILRRRRNIDKKNRTGQTHAPQEEASQSHNSKDLISSEQLKTENPYTDKEEGDYDHLGQSGSRIKILEDTYNHAGFVIGSGDNEYDTTININRQDHESTYDHAGHHSDGKNLDYDYGYNFSTGQINDIEGEYTRTIMNPNDSSI